MAQNVLLFASNDCTVFGLSGDNSQWEVRGKHGFLQLYYNAQNPSNIGLSWESTERNTSITKFEWKLSPRKLKSKGDRAWVLRASDIRTNISEVLALRFPNHEMFTKFEMDFYSLMPQNLQEKYLKKSNNKNKTNGEGHGNNDNNKAWECTQCTYNNPNGYSHCMLCNSPKPLDTTYSQNRNNTSNVNNSGNNSGNNNGTTVVIPYQSEDEIQVSQQWVCGICSRINPSHLMKCQFCDAYQSRHTSYSITQVNENVTLKDRSKNSGKNNSKNNDNNDSNSNKGSLSNDNHSRNASKSIIPDRWECGACTLINYNTLKCSVCGAQYFDFFDGNGNGNDMNDDKNKNVNQNSIDESSNTNKLHDSNLLSMSSISGLNNDNDNQSVISGYSTVTSNFGDKSDELNKVANDICILNANPGPIFHTLKTVTRKLVKNDIKYRILDTTNPKVTEKLLGYEGVLDFLTILGFESDFLNYKLICQMKPSQQIIDKALEILTTYENQFNVGQMSMFTPGPTKGMKKETFDDTMSETTENGLLSGFGSPTETGGNESSLLIDSNSVNTSTKSNNNDQGSGLTLDQIILWSTHENSKDFETMKTLIMTHKTFTDSLTLIRCLRRRFWTQTVPQHIQNDATKFEQFQKDVQRKIQLKVIKALREWMKYYWDSDFAGNTQDKVAMRAEVSEWIDFMRYNTDEYLGGPWNKPIAIKLNKEFKGYCDKGGKFKKLAIKQYIDIENYNENFNGMLECSAYEIACQITLMDFDILRKVEARECLNQAWKKKDKEIKAPNILKLIDRSNNVSSLIQYCILKSDGLNKRVKMLKKCIKIGEALRELKNYNSLCAVWSGLNSNQIYKLSHAWEKLPGKHTTIFKQFGILFLSSKSWRNMRMIINNTSPPAIPYVGLILQDLVFIDDGTKNDVKLDQDLNAMNFHKLARLALCTKNISEFQQQGYENVIANDNETLGKYLIDMYDKCNQQTEDQLWHLSEACKLSDKKEAQQMNENS